MPENISDTASHRIAPTGRQQMHTPQTKNTQAASRSVEELESCFRPERAHRARDEGERSYHYGKPHSDNAIRSPEMRHYYFSVDSSDGIGRLSGYVSAADFDWLAERLDLPKLADVCDDGGPHDWRREEFQYGEDRDGNRGLACEYDKCSKCGDER